MEISRRLPTRACCGRTRRHFNQTTWIWMTKKEAKLASYWTLPFTELRLGMKVGGTTRWITFGYSASSLYSLIADGKYRRTSIGKSKWRSLLPTSSMQRNCSRVNMQHLQCLEPPCMSKSQNKTNGAVCRVNVLKRNYNNITHACLYILTILGVCMSISCYEVEGFSENNCHPTYSIDINALKFLTQRDAKT